MKTLLFYDLETSGLTTLDQILSYASIRVNFETFEVEEEHDIKVKWRRDAFPSYDAYQVHGISINDHQDGLSELEAILKMHTHVNTPNTWSGGYNTLGFDDGMLRFGFHRNLLTPYTHQFRDGCGRFDILPMVVFYYLFAQEMLKWPKHPDGRVSFKLEDLNRENEWLEGNAHEALHDVRVTLALARCLRMNKPMWDYLIGYYDKDTDLSRVNALQTQQDPYKGVGVMVDLKFGADNQYHVPVLYLGKHHHFKNNMVFLRLDKNLDLKDEAALEKMVVRKKVAEPGFVLPYSDKYQRQLAPAVKEAVEQNLVLIKDTETFMQTSQHLRHLELPEITQPIDTDAALYSEGFMSVEEADWCQQFVLSGPEKRKQLLDEISNRQIYKRALRILWRFFPQQLPADKQVDALSTMRDYLYHGVDHRGQERQTLDALLEDFKSKEDAESKAILEHLMSLKQSLTTLE